MVAKMEPDLLKQLTNQFSGETLNKVASAIGEPAAKTESALGAVLPTLLSAISSKAATTTGANEVLNAIKSNNLDSTQFSSAADALSSPNAIDRLKSTGQSLLNLVLGPKSSSVIDGIASYAGIGRTSASTLVSLALPIALSLIGRRVVGGGVSGLMNLLSGQNYLRGVPAGLASLLGLGVASGAARPVVEDTSRREAVYAHEPTRTSSWWKWALPLVLLAGLIWWLTSLFNRTPPPVAVTTPAPAPAVPATAVPNPAPPTLARPDLGAFIDKSLPNGVSLHIPTNGIESRFLAFVTDASQGVNKETWFSFDRLEFETDSAKLKPTSEEQLRNMAEILKAYPNVNVKIGGYTDNTGNPAHNLQLSQDRAVNTMNEIASLGIDKSRLAAEGYGQKFPVADNATEEGRQRNRRIDIRVTKK